MIKTRFAPSPTGYLHLGSVRTALYSWLHAKANKGIFVLRIEDTDRERSTQASVDAILEGMHWLGLDYDEGPIFQTDRFERYREVADTLLAQGHAYRCTCSKERLEKLRADQIAQKQKARYDGHCRNANHPHSDTEAYVIRFRNPERESVEFKDIVRGQVVYKMDELDDLILVRSDGTPTYNFTVVVDDWEMKITHVIRGDDHINNTPRQINLFHALGETPPQYAHIPSILGKDGKRLSKRHGAVNILHYREEGYLADAMINYLVRLGWSYGDQEIFTRQEIIEKFRIEDVHKSPAAFNPEKLLWLNQQYIISHAISDLSKALKPFLTEKNIDIPNGPALEMVVEAQRERAKTLKEMAEKSAFFYDDAIEFDEKAVQKNITEETKPLLKAVHDRLAELENWDKEAIHQVIVDVAEQHQVKMGKVAQPIRVSVTGGTVSPPIDVTLFLLGKEKTLQRIKNY